MSVLIVFVRWPEPGRVKTRLARALGDQQAARLYRAFTEDLLERLGATPHRVVVAYDPGWPRDAYRRWLGPGPELVSQGSGDLGARMRRMVAWGLHSGADGVVLLGSDMPHLLLGQLDAAFEQLARADLVLGPCDDGGYYLAAMRRVLPVFEDVPWSTSDVLPRTLDKADRAGLRVALLASGWDVDEEADWRRLAGELLEGRIDPRALPRTASLARSERSESLPGGCPGARPRARGVGTLRFAPRFFQP